MRFARQLKLTDDSPRMTTRSNSGGMETFIFLDKEIVRQPTIFRGTDCSVGLPADCADSRPTTSVTCLITGAYGVLRACANLNVLLATRVSVFYSVMFTSQSIVHVFFSFRSTEVEVILV